jgi:hypothetical protein
MTTEITYKMSKISKLKAYNERKKEFRYFELLYEHWYTMKEAQPIINKILKGINKKMNNILANVSFRKDRDILKELKELYPEIKLTEELNWEGQTIQEKIEELPMIYRVLDDTGKKRWVMQINLITIKVKKEIPQFISYILDNFGNKHFDSVQAISDCGEDMDFPQSYYKMVSIFDTPEYQYLQSLIFEEMDKKNGLYRLKIDYWI